jgi:hypothetical protein
MLTLEDVVTELLDDEPLLDTCCWKQRTLVRVQLSPDSDCVVQPGWAGSVVVAGGDAWSCAPRGVSAGAGG